MTTTTTTTAARNPHLSDPTLRPFLHPTFSPIDYLNSTLPSSSSSSSSSSLSLGGRSTTTTKGGGPQQQQPPPSSSTTTTLSTLTSQTQSHTSTLNAQHTRLSTTLTDLTDEILRTSSRLAYEVELLRGEAVGLAETLKNSSSSSSSSSRGGVSGDAVGMMMMMPNAAPPPPQAVDNNANHPPAEEKEEEEEEGEEELEEPAALPHLRTLHQVRKQLHAVIQTFNTALTFPLPPSTTTTNTITSAIVSIQPPGAAPADPDASKAVEEEEGKGQAALARLKGGVVDLLRVGEVGRARERVEELRGVCGVWRGTGEERARRRWVEGLEGLVEAKEEEEEEEEERERGMGMGVGRAQRGGGAKGRREGSVGGGGGGGRQTPSGEKAAKESGTGGGGFLRRLRDEIYLD